MSAGLIKSIADAVREVARVIGNWQVSRDKRRMRACIEAGEKYIQINEKFGQFANISQSRQKNLLRYYRKKFFAYNQ